MARIIRYGLDNNKGEVLVPKPCTSALLWVHFGFKRNNKGRWKKPSVKFDVKKCQSKALRQQILDVQKLLTCSDLLR